MNRPEGDAERLVRVNRLRTEWRDAEDKDTDESGDDERQRQTDALGANDRIRAEAPDDLETRRRADQFEREIRRSE